MNTRYFLFFCALVGYTLAAVAPPVPENKVPKQDDGDNKPDCPEETHGISHRDVEMLDIIRALDRAAINLTEKEQERLDDMLEAGRDDDDYEEDGDVEGDREKRDCGGCSISCPKGSCSCEGCRCKCKCSWWGGKPKCKSKY